MAIAKHFVLRTTHNNFYFFTNCLATWLEKIKSTNFTIMRAPGVGKALSFYFNYYSCFLYFLLHLQHHFLLTIWLHIIMSTYLLLTKWIHFFWAWLQNLHCFVDYYLNLLDHAPFTTMLQIFHIFTKQEIHVESYHQKKVSFISCLVDTLWKWKSNPTAPKN